MNFVSWERAVLIFSVFCPAFLLFRMWRQGLAGRYCRFAAFLAGASVQSAAALPLNHISNAYAVVYFISSPVLWLLSYLVVLELYRLILEDYPGISGAGRKAVSWAMAFSILIAAAMSAASRLRSGRFPFLAIFYAVEEAVIFALLLFLVLIQLFLLRYRLRLSPNRVYYSVGYAFYFGVGTAADIVEERILGAPAFLPVSLILSAAANAILLAGAFLLTEEGETRPAPDAAESSSDQQRMQRELAEMNQLLTRVARGGR